MKLRLLSSILILNIFYCLPLMAIVLPNKVMVPLLSEFNSINTSDATYRCERDHQAKLTYVTAKSGPKLGATIYAYGYSEYSRRVKRVKDGLWRVTRIDARGLRFVKKVSNGKSVGKEYMLNRFGYLEQLTGSKKMDGKCIQIGENLVLNSGDKIGKVVAVGDNGIAVYYQGNIQIEQPRYFKSNCK